VVLRKKKRRRLPLFFLLSWLVVWSQSCHHNEWGEVVLRKKKKRRRLPLFFLLS
jgi:hypothetical protein